MFKCDFPGREKNEKIIKIVRKHWTAFNKSMLIIILLFAVPVLIYFVLNNFFPRILDFPYYPFIIIIASLYFLFAWYLAFVLWVDYYYDVWIITDQRIIDIEQRSIFERVISTVKLYRIQDATAEIKGFFPSLFNYGDLHIQTAGETVRFVFEKIHKPHEIKTIITRLQDQALAEQEKAEEMLLQRELRKREEVEEAATRETLPRNQEDLEKRQ